MLNLYCYNLDVIELNNHYKRHQVANLLYPNFSAPKGSYGKKGQVIDREVYQKRLAEEVVFSDQQNNSKQSLGKSIIQC